MALIRLIFWVALFLVSTFVFTVLFEHGVTDFGTNARKELDSLKEMTVSKPEPKKPDSTSLGH